MKNSADLGGCYPPRPSASVDNTLLDLQNSSYPTQPHSITANYFTWNWNRSGSTCTLSWLVLSGSLPSFQIMLACWSLECDNRPSFQTLSEELFNMQKEEQPYVNVDPSQAFILPPTAGRGMKRRQQIEWRDRPLYVQKWNAFFEEKSSRIQVTLVIQCSQTFSSFQTLLEILLPSVTERSVGRPLIMTKLKWRSFQKRR